jgi:hypothetical protein
MIKKTENILVGYSSTDITPEPGDFCSFRLAPNKRSLGVHDRLYIHAVAIDNGTHELLMLSVDAMALDDKNVKKIKSAIKQKTGLASSQVIIAATHTHNGAELFGEEPFIENNKQIRHAINMCVLTACRSLNNKFPARLGWGYVIVPGIAKNRFENRFNGNISKVDNRIDFLKIEDILGNYRGVIWHFAAHPTTCMMDGYMSSADYYGQANKFIMEKLGGFSVFFNGACGNVNPELGERSFERSIYYARKIADKLVNAIPGAETSGYGKMLSEQLEITVPLNDKQCNPSDNRQQILDYFSNIENKNILPTVAAYDKHIAEYHALRSSWWKHRFVEEFTNTNSAKICLQAHYLVGVLILTVPGEIFIELQFELQKAFPANRAVIFGYANGYFGYIPDRESYKINAYETTPSYMHRAGQKAGQKIVRIGIRILKKLNSAIKSVKITRRTENEICQVLD